MDSNAPATSSESVDYDAIVAERDALRVELARVRAAHAHLVETYRAALTEL